MIMIRIYFIYMLRIVQEKLLNTSQLTLHDIILNKSIVSIEQFKYMIIG